MQAKKCGLIILNLGSPASYLAKDVKVYLDEFLMDERVIDIPYLLRTLVVKGFITPFRSAKSAEAYKTIWTAEGSPLIVISEAFKKAVAQKINMPVAISMRYGKPKPEEVLREIEKNGTLDEILIAPMYPHYAMSSYETAVDYMQGYLKRIRPNISLKILKPFYNEPGYIEAMVVNLKTHLKDAKFDACLFSYHGLPVRHLKKADPTHQHCYSSGDCCEIKSIAWQTCYKHQVKTTTKLIADKIGWQSDKVFLSFQSRLGADQWIEPYTDKLFMDLPKAGIKKLAVICPAFVADCLETLEEIQVRGKESFIASGGEELIYVPCLNTNALWVDTFAAYCNEYEGSLKQLWT
jgi:ferrochelatase